MSSSPPAFFVTYGSEVHRAWKTIDPAALSQAAAVLLEAYTDGRRVFSCGNGGSASVANHLACDHVKGTRTATALTPKVTSLAGNTELITAIANDISYTEVFTYQLQSQAEEGDVLVAVSSSGHSANIVSAAQWARANGLHVIALTGFTGGQVSKLAEVSVHVDCDNYGVVEDVHQSVAHALAQYLWQPA